MTFRRFSKGLGAIIPYQELLGNYDIDVLERFADIIIPYQELLGNYDSAQTGYSRGLLGNYDLA